MVSFVLFDLPVLTTGYDSSLNDELVYKTRVKPITSYPMFNAGTERFVKDWRKAHVTVAVKDSRLRENDAILGIVMLKVSGLNEGN